MAGVIATRTGLAAITQAPKDPPHIWDSPDRGVPLSEWRESETDPLVIWKTQPAVRKVVGFAAEQIAQLPWHVYERVGDGDRQRRANSPAERIWDQPMPHYLGAMVKEMLLVDMMLYDRWCAILFQGQVVRLPARYVRVKSNPLGFVTSIKLEVGAEIDVDLTDAPLMIGWGWSDTKAGGISPLTTLAEILEESRRSVRWRREQWEERPKFAGLLKHPSKFKDTITREKFVVSWRDWLTGSKEGTPILEDGLDYLPIDKADPDKFRDIEGRRLTDEEVCGAYHIPPELVGARPGNFSNMQAFRSMLYGPTLGPRINKLQESANALLPFIDATPNLYLEISREAAMNGSLIEQARVIQTMTGGPIMTRAEGRSRFNLPRIEGTDELITPLNVIEGGQASPTDSGSQNERVDSEPKREVEAS